MNRWNTIAVRIIGLSMLPYQTYQRRFADGFVALHLQYIWSY